MSTNSENMGKIGQVLVEIFVWICQFLPSCCKNFTNSIRNLRGYWTKVQLIFTRCSNVIADVYNTIEMQSCCKYSGDRWSCIVYTSAPLTRGCGRFADKTSRESRGCRRGCRCRGMWSLCNCVCRRNVRTPEPACRA